MTNEERPDGTAYREAQRALTERNDQARKSSQERAEKDRKDIAQRRAERERGVIYR